MRLILLVLPFSILIMNACSSGGQSGGGTPPIEATKILFDHCTSNEECIAGECVTADSVSFCTQTCSSPADCKSPYDDWLGDCAPSGDTKKCFFPCTFPSPDSCSECGCQDPNAYCENDACVPKKALFEDCEHNLTCASGNCSPHPSYEGKKCLSAYGGPCTSDNCELCLDGVFCSRRCGGDTGIEFCFELDWPTSECIVSADNPTGVCYPACNTAGQSQCDPYGADCTTTTNGSAKYCKF